MRKISVLVAMMLVTVFASAATLTGTVKNMTTGEPSAGDEVALLALSQGMSEQAKTKTDANGAFTFDIADGNTPHLVRVTHDGVNYFPAGGPVRPGMTNVDIPVYDGAKKVDGISTTVNVMRVQADGGNLQILQLIAVNNGSKPPRTLAGDSTYEFYLPAGAEVDQTIVQAPGGMPVNIAPVPDGKSGRYHVGYAMKPGETRLEVAYHLPYSGEATFTPKVTDNIQHFVVMMPKSMKFEAKDAARFAPMNDDPNALIQVATQVTPATDLAFRVSGTGLLPDEQGTGQQAQSGGGGMGGGAVADNRPGGGLGAPIDSPDPLHKYRWMILGGLAIVMVSGGVFVVSRANQQAGASAPVAATPSATPVKAEDVAAPVGVSAPVVNGRSGMLLEALKEEMFQLEVEKQEGRISADEYEKSREALNQTLQRALARQKS